jgi:hypothetical protein
MESRPGVTRWCDILQLVPCRKLAEFRKPIKLVKPSSTIHKPTAFTLVPEGPSARSPHLIVPAKCNPFGPAGVAARSLWPSAHAYGSNSAQKRSNGDQHQMYSTSLYMHGPREGMHALNFHWAAYSMATGGVSLLLGPDSHAYLACTFSCCRHKSAGLADCNVEQTSHASRA